jgi:flavin-dependent dehydrogenase
MRMARNPDAIIVGAGPAGPACDAMMKGQGLDVVVREKA